MAGVVTAVPGEAGAQQCPEANPSYADACGPTFVLPPWGDAGGWTDPSKYSTIQLADVNGDGTDELIARNDQGLEILWFDTTVGQWRPQADADGVQQILTDFRSPVPSQESDATTPDHPWYYSTIQAADIDGRPGEEILARFSDGMRVYQYAPPAGGSGVDGGTWKRIGTAGPFPDKDDYGNGALFPTIQVGQFKQGNPPLLFARRHTSAFPDMPIVFYSWDGGTWNQVATPYDDEGYYFDFIDSNCSKPSCYLTLQTADIAPGSQGAPDDAAELIGRTSLGAELWGFDARGQWSFLNLDYDITPDGLPPFGDARSPGPDYPVPDCPFSAGGATGAGSDDCLGSSPSYYETLQAADIDGVPGDELLARASDGLRVRKWVPGPSGGSWQLLTTLTPLAGAATSVQAGMWGSIRTGDIDGDSKDEVLALDGKALQAWSYDGTSDAWSRLQPSTALALTGGWMTKPEYYSTIQTGDVDGDKHDDVIARGPYGIRTWFYNRRGTGGWERYLADGYQAFPGTSTTGLQGAFNRLNDLALQKGAITSGKIRDVWTGENAPNPNAPPFSNLQVNLAGSTVGNCTQETNLAPPTYASCALPDDMSGYTFTAAEWTAVVNEMLSEAYFAQQVVAHFGDLDTIRQSVFESESGAMPAIATDLQLAAAAGNTTEFDLQNFFAGLTGVTASIAGLIPVGGPEISAGLWVASEIVSMLPSASPTANSSFQTTYDGLLDKVATARDEMDKALKSQSQQVRVDQGLLELVGRLRSRGTWVLNIDGMESTSREAFVLETYKALMPTVYHRYRVTNCANNGVGRYCHGPSPGPGVIGNSQSFTTIGLPPTTNWGLPATPCIYHANTHTYYCHYETNGPAAGLMSRIWGPVSSICDYEPGNASTTWTFGCSLGLPAATSVGSSPGWAFTTHTGSPVTMNASSAVASVRASSRAVRARAARAGSDARAPRVMLGPLRFTGRLFFSRRLRPQRMSVVVERTLFEHGRREELARTGSGSRLRPFALRHVRDGLFTARKRGGPRVRLRLRRLNVRGAGRVDLRLTRVRTRDVRALCTMLPASVSRAGRPLELETRMRLRDGAEKHLITMRQHWRCVRDRKGEFAGIRPIKPKSPTARPGLAVRLRAPRILASGRRAAVRATVVNQRRRRPGRVVSSLWHLQIAATAGGPTRTVRLDELRAQRSRTVRVTVPVPRRARARVCVRVAAAAASARGAHARRCVRVPGTGAPHATR